MLNFTQRLWKRKRYAYFSVATQHDRRRKLRELVSLLLAAALIHTAAIWYFEGFGWWDSFWVTMTTMTTVGYGDQYAITAGGRIATIVVMYIFGIFLLAQIAGEWIDFRLDRRERMRKGFWRWKMQDHIVILNSPDQNGAHYLQILVEQIRASTSLADYPIQIFSPHFPDGLPGDLASQGVVLHSGTPEGRTSLEVADVSGAAFIVVMAVDTTDPRSDSVTIDILDQLKGFDLQGHVIAECVQDENRERLRSHGAHAVIRPVRAYPELMVRAMAAPGTEVILENLFDHQGVRTERFDVAFGEQPWGELAGRLLIEGFGTPVGYVGVDGVIVANPSAKAQVAGKGLFLMVNHDEAPQAERVRAAVEQWGNTPVTHA